jgi:hypothetical protein
MFGRLKLFLPDRPVNLRVILGPFRGAVVRMNPRSSLRKVMGLYEHELNSWLNLALPRVSRVLDVGANDGYFTFGCAAAFRRLGVAAEILSFEGQARHVQELKDSAAMQPRGHVRFQIVHAMVGREVGKGVTCLDACSASDRHHTLIKIDVEGAEVDVIQGASQWMDRTNLFVIEVHKREYLDLLQHRFRAFGHPLIQVNQAPLRALGRETRDADNWWLVSDLGKVR